MSVGERIPEADRKVQNHHVRNRSASRNARSSAPNLRCHRALASSSLTYHLTSNQGRSNLRRVFNSCFKNLQGLSSDLFDTYKQTGISPKEIEGLSSRNHDNLGCDRVEVEDLCKSQFIGTMLQLTDFTLKQLRKKSAICSCPTEMDAWIYL